MYYPQEIIDQVIAANDIVSVIGEHVHMKRSGSGYMGLCPFHNEKSPSFSVSPGKQVYHCFGCGESGNVVTFVMKYENATFQEALKILADRAGIKLPEAQYSEESKKKNEQRDRLFAINKDAATYYFRLLRSPRGRRGMDYFRQRQLSDETLNRFGLGFADGADSDLVAYLRKRGYADEDILLSGVAAFDEKRGLHDKFWNRVMYPIMDVTNRVIGFGGRVMGDGKPKYLNSPETPIFDKSHNLYGLNLAKRSRCGYFILCEGYMDVIAMHQAGFSQAVASLGTSFTEGQAQILKRYVPTVLLSYDSDGAGVKAAMRNIGILHSAGLTGKVVDLRPYKDPDEFMKGAGKEEFQKRLDNAENSFLYQIRQVQTNYDLSDPAAQTRFYHEIARRLCEFDDEIERENYTKKMADLYFIPLETLRREVASYQMAGGAQTLQTRQLQRQKPVNLTEGKRRGKLEEAKRRNERLLLTWISDDSAVYLQLRPYLRAEDFAEGVYRTAAGRYFEILDKRYGDALQVEAGTLPEGSASPAAAVACFDSEEEQKEAAQLFETRMDGVQTKEEREKALKDVILSVKRNALEQSMLSLQGNPNALQTIVKLKKQIADLEKLEIRITQ
ncbi:MAG TPA: DNA primase [Lachnospiraceae bacterium]|nr:DNA primase [Lachnospiraceae bacterium]